MLVTWSVLLALYGLGRARGTGQGQVVTLHEDADRRPRPGDAGSQVGTLWVFLANIGTCILVLTAPRSATVRARLDTVRLPLPRRIRTVGAALFVVTQTWGLWAMLANPTYTPLTRSMKRRFVLATTGPYAVVRHPRYLAEAGLNLALFLFTGIWLPLLGLLGWRAMARQAAAEEQALLETVGEPYQAYRERTGNFWPRCTTFGPDCDSKGGTQQRR